MNKVFFIGGILHDNEVNECLEKHITFDSAAHNFQKKFLEGFSEMPTLINAPFISGSKEKPANRVSVEKNGKILKKEHYLNVRYVNLLFKHRALKKVINGTDFSNSVVFIYAIHTPFLQIAEYIKKKYTGVRVVQIVPDLPQYMNTTDSGNVLYKLLKAYDIRKINRLLHCVDYFVPFTKTMMDDYLHVFNKPYYVMEGIYNDRKIAKTENAANGCEEKIVVYTGTLNVKYGIGKLVEAFSYNKDPNLKLCICGDGEMRRSLEEQKRAGVEYLGMLPYDKAMDLAGKAALLVNPREANEVYTKYSFPSKVFDYLSTGNPIICFKLAGIPDEYDAYLHYFESNDPQQMMAQMAQVAYTAGSRGAQAFLQTKCAAKHVEKIFEMIRLHTN